jgi:6-phosphogluconolactonase
MDLDIEPDEATLTEVAAQLLAAELRAAVAARGIAHIALSGGSTPESVYRRLADLEVAWERVQVWFGDERAVPPDDPGSNFAMAERALLDHAPIPAANVHRMLGELDAVEAARRYEAELADHFGRVTVPVLDLVHLGMGEDGHCASLFPNSPALDEQDAWVVANRAPVAPHDRVTFTYPVLDAARHVLFLVAGAAKAVALRDVLEGPTDHRRLPAQAVAPIPGRLTWLVDAAAGSLLGSPL